VTILSVLDCVDENLSEVESSGSDNEIDVNQETARKSGTSDGEECNGKATPVIIGWQM
jgi:hypothetical protein